MVTLNISLPEPMQVFIEARMAESGFNSVSEYFFELVRLDQVRKDQKKLEGVLSARQQGYDWEEMMPSDWDALRGELKSRLAMGGAD
jgi:antitoxin ParD1/3/4